jgi:hypothetical protein
MLDIGYWILDVGFWMVEPSTGQAEPQITQTSPRSTVHLPNSASATAPRAATEGGNCAENQRAQSVDSYFQLSTLDFQLAPRDLVAATIAKTMATR